MSEFEQQSRHEPRDFPHFTHLVGGGGAVVFAREEVVPDCTDDENVLEAGVGVGMASTKCFARNATVGEANEGAVPPDAVEEVAGGATVPSEGRDGACLRGGCRAMGIVLVRGFT